MCIIGYSLLCYCSPTVISTTVSADSSDLSFDQMLYHRQVAYDEVQEVADLIFVEFNQELENHTISRTEVVGDAKFDFNTTNFIVYNLVPLQSGQYDFLIVAVADGSLLRAVVVVDVLSQGKRGTGN